MNAAILAGCFFLAALQGQSPDRVQVPIEPSALMEEVDRLGSAPYWPGFAPLSIPVALFDGKETLLYRHPDPPEGFTGSADRKDVYVYRGRHPALRANTSVELGGVLTATFLLDAFETGSLRAAAAVVLHECFHVFQKQRCPAWGTNEALLFAYPADDPEVLALRRLETAALRETFEAKEETERSRWLKAALDLRRRRFATLPEGSVRYERSVELVEGTAYYAEGLAAKREGPMVPAAGFPAEQVRLRAYTTGQAWCHLLDRHAPGWKKGILETEDPALDLILLKAWTDPPEPAAFTAELVAAITEKARTDAAAVRASRLDKKTRYLDRDGWSIVIDCGPGHWFFPAGFDPMNVVILPHSEVLHTRWLKLKGPPGEMEALEVGALTFGAGEHPLFNGIKRIMVCGLEGKPEVEGEGGSTAIAASGFSARLKGARLQWKERQLRVILGKPGR